MITATRPAGRHRDTGHRDHTGRPIIAAPVGPAYSPLAPATRQAIAPHHWADRQLPADAGERTGWFDTTAVLAASTTATAEEPPADRAAVLAAMRDELTATAQIPAITDPIGAQP